MIGESRISRAPSGCRTRRHERARRPVDWSSCARRASTPASRAGSSGSFVVRDVEQRPELVDVAIAVAEERDVRRDVERRARHLRRKRVRLVAEVVVAVDEDARVLVGQRAARALSMAMSGKLRLMAPRTCSRSYFSRLRASSTMVPGSRLMRRNSASSRDGSRDARRLRAPPSDRRPCRSADWRCA